MVERIEDLNLPNAVVTRLMKDALPDGVSISKEARSALTRAASVFILYLTTSASSAAKDKKVKTMTANHIFEALEEIEFENFVEPLKKFLEAYRASQKTQKNKKESSKGSKTANGTAPSSDTNKKQKEGSDSGSDVELVDEP